jgi:Bacterial pre-peptidase C-terminal domain
MEPTARFTTNRRFFMRSLIASSPSLFRLALLAALLTALPVVARQAAAQTLPVARLSSVFPPGAKQGTAIDVTITGNDLDNVSKLHFSDPAITAVQKTQPPALGQEGPQPTPGQFTLTIAPEAKPGICEVRAIGKYGVSNPRAFVIGTRDELLEKEPNNTREQATELALGTLVNGQSNGASDQDYFKITATSGQRIIADCWAYRIDSKMDATLVLYDAAGKELATNRDTNRRDPLLDFTVPADGVYYLEIHDFLYEGGSDYFYRLAVGNDAYLDFVFPPAGVPGSHDTYTLYGRNLPGGQPTKLLAADGKSLESLALEIAVPSDDSVEQLEFNSVVEPDESGVDGMAYRLPTPGGESNSVRLGFATAPIIAEAEPNDDPSQAQAVTAPCEYMGQFFPQTDRDWITFTAKKGEALWMEVFSQRMGLSTDPYLLVQQVTKNDKGEEEVKDIKGVDDYLENPPGQVRRGMSLYDMKTDDPAFRFVAPEDGTYRVLVRNLANYTHADPRLVYRLAIRPAKPDFRVVAKPRLIPFSTDPNQNPPTVWSPLLRKGGTELVDVVVFRRDGFTGEVQVSVEGLPQGVTCAPITIGPDEEVGALVLAAAEDAPESMSLLSINATAKIGDAQVVRPARTATMVWGGAINQVTPRSRLSRNLAVAVSGGEIAPFFIEADSKTVLEMSKAGKIQVPLKVVRRGDFKGPIVLAPNPLPPNVKPPSITLDEKTTEGKLEITLAPNTPPGTYSFTVLGTTQVNYARNPEAVKEATDRQAAVDKIVAERTAVAKTATDAKTAAEKQAADMTSALEKARQAAQAAAKAAEDAAAQAKVAADAKAAAEKAMADAETQAKAAVDAKAAAEKVAVDADAQVKEAAAVKQTVDKAVTDATNQAKPKAINVAAPSPTVTIKVTEAPITLEAAAPPAGKPATTVEVPLKINRLYGFADAVTIKSKPASAEKDFKVADVTLAADAAEGKVAIEIGPETKPGNYDFAVQAIAKFNGQDLSVTQTVTLTIEPTEPPK